MTRALAGAGIVAITLLSYFQFPGHTYLQQDTQIYAPILENLRDPTVLRNEMLVQRPHVAYTLYDEVTIGLERITGLTLSQTLRAEQIVFRALNFWGIYLIAASFGLSAELSLLVTAMWALGATIVGPAVLTIEYEPTPRAFAVPLLFLAVGLIASQKPVWGAAAGAAAFLMHPPTTYPFWAVYLAMALCAGEARKRALWGLVVLAGAACVLFIAARLQVGPSESQTFFTKVPALQEQLQRMRAPYNWVSTWWRELAGQYLAYAGVVAVALWRLWPEASRELRYFLIGMPVIGILSVPASYVMLEQMKWALIPQVQPTRALLFVTAVAGLLASIAGVRAAILRNYLESVGFLLVVYVIPMQARVFDGIGAQKTATAILLTAIAAVAVSRFRPAVAIAATAPFFAIPLLAGIHNYPAIRTPELGQLAVWAREKTPKDAVFLFADAGRRLEPGVFRSEAMRAIYVDWKGGGQVNYVRELGEEWWARWESTLGEPFRVSDAGKYRKLGIDYVVVLPKNRIPGAQSAYENTGYLVYDAALL